VVADLLRKGLDAPEMAETADPRIAFAAEPDELARYWQRLAVRDSASPKVWMDAYLAAFALAGGHQVVTIDAAFRQYEGLNPVVLAQP
jgi:predicted nucleic acid-binding protein